MGVAGGSTDLGGKLKDQRRRHQPVNLRSWACPDAKMVLRMESFWGGLWGAVTLCITTSVGLSPTTWGHCWIIGSAVGKKHWT